MLAHHFRRRPTGFAVRWACLAIAFVLVCASGGPAGSATGGLAANAFSVNPSPQVLSHRAATAPVVYPSLREWHGSTGAWHLSEASRIVVDARDAMVLRDTATTFHADLASESGHPPYL
jgi:hexosaminidase